MCMFTDGTVTDIHAYIAEDDRVRAENDGPGLFYINSADPCFRSCTYVKEAEFFAEQGGLEKPWGKKWKGPIKAKSIEDARDKGFRLARKAAGMDPNEPEPRWGCPRGGRHS